jgi:hypothetical protein
MTIDATVRSELLKVAREALKIGPGYAQEGYVLGEVGKKLLARGDIAKQQSILNAWQDLFRQGELVWGYDLDNPQAPFFHEP